jgi:hypothetical protein
VRMVGFKKGLKRVERGERSLIMVEKEMAKDLIECLLKI